MDFSQIDPHLFQGTAPLTPRDIDLLRTLGVRATVDMRAEADAHLPIECVLWLPTVDGEPATVGQLVTGIQFIDHCIRLGWGVYVYCLAGIGRSPMMVAAYLIGRRGMDAEEAIENIRQHRPQVNPSPFQMHAAEAAGQTFREVTQEPPPE
ncbi:MAG: dual specificity protein phosphatase family protein [Candidatus Methylomirabilales bacterium]